MKRHDLEIQQKVKTTTIRERGIKQNNMRQQ